MNDDNYLRDSEIALMDAIKTVLEVIVAKRIVPPELLGEVFAKQRDTYPKEAMPKAVFVDGVASQLRNGSKTDTGSALSRGSTGWFGLKLWPHNVPPNAEIILTAKGEATAPGNSACS